MFVVLLVYYSVFRLDCTFRLAETVSVFFCCYYKECVDDEQSNQLVAPELYFLLLEVPPVLLIHEHEVQEVLDGELVVDIFV